jgi:rSAM/selenodomain-associated transferase 1
MNYPASRLLVFSKAPHAGAVKTRLITRLGAQGAADLQARLIHRCLETVTGAGLCPVELWCAPSSREPFFEACRERYGIELYNQPPGDLGERMHAALASALGRGEAAVLVGTDIPSLETADLDAALQALRHGKDAVVGPASDGGYYLIGVRHADRRLFESMPWGTPAVFRETSTRLRRLSLEWLRLRERSDVDTPEDFHKLPESIRIPPASGDAARDGRHRAVDNGNKK